TAEADVDLVAVFTLKTFEVTVTAEPEEGGVVSGGGTYDCGSEVTVVATPADCYDFDGWFVGETLVSEDAEYTFTAEADVDLVAVFTLKTFEVTVTAEPEEGGVVSGGGTYDCGTEVTVTAEADECYDFVGWFVGETLVSEDAEYTFTAEADVDLVAVFTIKTYVVTSTAGEDGAVDPEGETVVDCGDDLLFTFTPDEGYGVDQVTVDGVPVDVVGSPDTTDKTYNLEDIRDNHAIDATFKQVFFVTDFDFQAQSPLGNRYDVYIEVDPEVTLLKFSYPDNDTELPVPEAPVVGGVANIVNFFTLDDADFLLIRAFTADGNLLAELVVELDYSEAFLKVATFTPKEEWSLPSAVIYDVHIEVSDNVDKVEFAYPGNPEAEPIPAMAVPVGGVIDIEMNSVDFDAEEITVMAYSGAELLVSKNFDLLKVIEATCEFVADYPILGISEYKFTVVVNSPFCASIEFAADGEIQVIEGNPFVVPDLGTYEFRVFVASELNRVDVMAKDAADDKIAERNIDLP
ncbi:InlB B-repeat-containing protein, partial [Mesotoga sp. HF07.pep.5.2.highcov]|uniref:InlB B-repeat-containing protein n=1 Tax=Mesotoga sp. HF07.pep.5.2.highcov TaxID=1462923 RepID=UPI001602740A